MKEFQRWYDKIPQAKEVFMVLKNMPENDLDKCSKVLYGVIVEHKNSDRNSSKLSSLGTEKIRAYYKSFQKRRWYDQNPSMFDSARSLSVMDPAQVKSIIRDFMFNLKMKGLSSIYDKNKADS